MKKKKRAKASSSTAKDTDDTSIARARKIDIRWHERFLAQLQLDMRVYVACQKVGKSRNCAYEHKELFPVFSARWDQIIEEATDDLEQALIERAVHGVDSGIYQHGKRVGTKTEYSDHVGIFLLKNRRKHIYGDKIDLTHTAKPFSDEEMMRQGALAAEGLISTIRASLGGKVVVP
jgi:hypothetical protein